MAELTSARCGPASDEDGQGPDDGTILAAVARGDLSGFDTFVDRYKRRLMGYVTQRIGDTHAAEDLVQEVFLKAFRIGSAGGRVRRPAALASDLDAEQDQPGAIDSSGSGDPGPVEEAISAERQPRIHAILARLPEPQREVVTLRVFGELTFREIAEVTGAAMATVKSRMRYALVKIRHGLHGGGESQP